MQPRATGSHAIDVVPHAASAEAVLAAFEVTSDGLSAAEVARRRARFGPNQLREIASRSAWKILVDQFRGVLILLLAAAAALALFFGQRSEAAAVLAVLLVNGAIGFFSELRAVQSMAALRKLGSVAATVRRDGRAQRVDAGELVPGDGVIVEGGDVVTADLRLVEASKLQADESLLTGESVPVDKDVAPVAADAALAARTCMLFKGTAVTRGSGFAVVVGTGMRTELGRIARLIEDAEDETTPLEKRLDRLGRRLFVFTMIVAAGIAAIGLAAGRELLMVAQTSIALAVATVPEGLPIITTLALARGMRRMARRNAVVNRLSAVETLGATGIIFSDKTGTLTENRMTVVELVLPDGVVRVGAAPDAFERDGAPLAVEHAASLRRALEIAALCNDASLDGVGDPLEVALLAAARKGGIARGALLARLPELREVAFDPVVKLMATVHRGDAGILVAVKGAPEAVLAACTRIAGAAAETPLDPDARRALLARNHELATRGMRVIALATRRLDDPVGDVFSELAFVGLVGLEDPPRRDARAAIDACRRAGIRVVMVTGDQPATALCIAREVGLVDGESAAMVQGSELPVSDERLLAASIFARISPEQKLELIARHQKHGAIVAMTGDGVNDAPALKKADIGVAMGLRGTEVARQAADVVLRDDAFGTIVAAIEEGRVIFRNIRTFVVYLLSCNVSEIGVVGLASALQAPLPILPLQILFLNIVTDVFPALALGFGEGDPGAMRCPPRDPRERVLEARHWRAIALYGALLTAAVLGALWIALRGLGASEPQAVTISFLTLAFAQLWHVFSMRGAGSGLVRNEITRNPWVWGALALCSALLLLAVYVPALAGLLRIEVPTAAGWVVIAVASVAPTAVAQIAVAFRSE